METMKCPNCGAEIASNAHFCQFCGATVSPQTPPSYTDPQTPPQASYTETQQPPYTGEQPPYANQQPTYTNQQPPYTPNGVWQGAPIPPGYQQKSKIAAGILGILLGALGIHNFYLGYTNKALIQLLVTVLTCGIGGFAMWIWGLVEGIQILTGTINVDAHGVPLGD